MKGSSYLLVLVVIVALSIAYCSLPPAREYPVFSYSGCWKTPDKVTDGGEFNFTIFADDSIRGRVESWIGYGEAKLTGYRNGDRINLKIDFDSQTVNANGKIVLDERGLPICDLKLTYPKEKRVCQVSLDCTADIKMERASFLEANSVLSP